MSLSVGDRRWAIHGSQVVEFLFIDQDDTRVRLLLPAEFAGGQRVQIGGHSVKLVEMRSQTPSGRAITTYPVGSTNTQVQAKLEEHGTPAKPPEISKELIEQYIKGEPPAPVGTDPRVGPTTSAPASVASEEGDTQVKILTMLYEMREGQTEIRSRLATVERERGLTGPRVSPRAQQPGVTFNELEDDEVSESELVALRAQVLGNVNSRQPARPLLLPDRPAPAAAGTAPAEASNAADREATLFRLLEKSLAKSTARSDNHDDLLYTGEAKSASGAKGMAKKAELDAKFNANPSAKYDYVMSQARGELNLREKQYEDAHAVKKYFKEFVPLGKFKMGMHMFELINGIHAAMLQDDRKRAKGLIAASYQFLEQYSIDSSPGKADYYLAHFATHQPALNKYPAEKPEEPIGKLIEREVAAAAHAYQRDLDQLQKHRDERLKKQ